LKKCGVINAWEVDKSSIVAHEGEAALCHDSSDCHSSVFLLWSAILTFPSAEKKVSLGFDAHCSTTR
jgi:hypothetical protein